MVEMEASWEFFEWRANGVKEVTTSWVELGETHFLHKNVCYRDCSKMVGYFFLLGMVVSPETKGFTHGIGKEGMSIADGEGKDRMVGVDQEEVCIGCHSIEKTMNCKESSMGGCLFTIVQVLCDTLQ